MASGGCTRIADTPSSAWMRGKFHGATCRSVTPSVFQPTHVVDGLGVRAVEHDVERLLLAPELAAQRVQLGDDALDLVLGVHDADPAVAVARRALQSRLRRAADVDRDLLLRNRRHVSRSKS